MVYIKLYTATFAVFIIGKIQDDGFKSCQNLKKNLEALKSMYSYFFQTTKIKFLSQI